MGGRTGWKHAAAGMLIAAAMLIAAGAAACAAPDPGPALPHFPTPAATSSDAPRPHHDGVLPDDCPAVLPVGDLGALLGLPLDTVAVRTTIGVPMPASGRTERIDCTYTGNGGPVRGKVLLSLAATGFRDRDAARAQWSINVDDTTGARKDVPIGSASAVLFTRPREVELAVVYGSSNLTLLLPDGPLPGGRTREDLVVDLALRVLPTMADAGAAPPSSSTPPPAGATPATANSPKASGDF